MRASISFLYSLPLIPVSAYRLSLFPSPLSNFFFAGFHGAQVATPQRPSSPTRVKRRRESGEEREQGGRRASCYICNVFAFTIFQLVCILEPLLLASTLVLSIFSPSSRLPLCYARTATGECRTLRFSRLLDHRVRGAIVLSVFPCAYLLPKPFVRGPQRISFSQIIPKTR